MFDKFRNPSFNKPKEKSPGAEGDEGREDFDSPEPIDFAKILAESNILFISDNHASFTNKDVFIQSLDDLKALGVTDVALEMLPEGFNTDNLQATL